MDDPVHVFFHTNRGVRPPPTHANLVAHAGWWADTHDMRDYELRTTKLFKRDEFPYHAKFAGLQGWKYQWLESATTGSASRSDDGFSFVALPEPWLLMDTDVVVQCSARELRERFQRFGAPLVVGAEFQWWPKRDKVALARGADPWPVQPPPFLRYPNSGLLAGTRFGFRQLEHAFRESSPRYPCCPKLHNGSVTRKCHIDDQHCLQTALLHGRSTGGSRSRMAQVTDSAGSVLEESMAVQYALDVNASLFLNLNGIVPSQLVRGPDGRCVYTATGTAPCVFHSNGKAAKPLMKLVFKCKHEGAWIVPKGGNISRAETLFKTTH